MSDTYQAIYDAVRSKIQNCDVESVVREAFSFVSEQGYTLAQEIHNISNEYIRPSVVFKPKIFIDGNQWCALYGDNIQDGICGFGDSPALAMLDFDSSYERKLCI